MPLYLGLSYWWGDLGAEPVDGMETLFLVAWYITIGISSGFFWAMLCGGVFQLLERRNDDSLGPGPRGVAAILIYIWPTILSEGLCMLPIVEQHGSRVIVVGEFLLLKALICFLIARRLSNLKGAFTVDQSMVRFQPNWMLYPRIPTIVVRLTNDVTVDSGSSKHGLLLNGEKLRGTQGLTLTERKGLVDWLQSHLDQAQGDKTLAFPQDVPDALEELRGLSNPEDMD